MSIPVLTTPPSTHTVIDVHDIWKSYGEGEQSVHALRGVSLTVDEGDFVAIMGASGSGKSTLMNMLGCLDVQTSGSYRLDGVDVASLPDGKLSALRNRKIGFIFQAFNLIPRMSAQANVELPMLYAAVSREERRQRARAALTLVGLADRANHAPSELSGGQQQRVAVARSLVNAPALILADEPTGNLDSKATNDVLDIFQKVNDAGRTVVIITHEDDVAARARRIVRMFDGEIVSDDRLQPVVSTAGIPS